ncbi:hypothetical protein HPB50_016487 [Hyalomma asiaticum]|uniref:Uncharacterized protein n=1 Tax=Hyalomma asiaticum TaxID=266040 RepID=A0ACB7S0K1_HYAAI|nr:hypothetical protein HPB50_016487 [Hyalomma asiaticum]
MRCRVVGTALFVSIVSVSCVLLIVAIALTPRKKVPVPPQPDCAVETLRELYANVNVTMEPCTHFTAFMCSRAHRRGPKEVVRYLENVVHPTLQGARQGSASRAIYLLHRSCVRYLLDPSTTPEVIWSQMVAVLQSFSASSSQLDPLQLVGLLDIRYNVEALLRSSVTSPWSQNMTLKLQPTVPSMPLLSDSSHTHQELLGRLLAFLNYSFNVSATSEGLRRLVDLLASNFLANSTGEVEEVTGRIFVLNEYLPTAAFKVWMDSLKAACACDGTVYADVKIYDAKLFLGQIDVCADRKYRDDLLAYMMAAASAKLFEEPLAASLGWNSPLRFDTCTSWVLNVPHIWDMVTIERHSDENKDTILRSLFNATVKTAAKDVETLLAPVGDVAGLRYFLSRLALLYPKWMVGLYADLLPTFESGRHVWNCFALREYSVRTLAMDAALDMRGKRIWKANTFATLVTISSRYVFFSPSIYSEMRTDCGPINSWFLNAHLVAVHLADSLAQKIHAEAVGGQFKGILAPESMGCFDDGRGDGRAMRDTVAKLQCPLLALRIVARALPFDKWRHQSASLGTWNVTRSQMFFMLLYNSEMCAASDMSEGGTTAPFLLQLPEFREAFGCRSPTTTTPTDVTTSFTTNVI